MSSPSANPTEAPARRKYRFADFTLDVDDGVLYRGTAEVRLRPKTFDVLTYLVERHGRLLTKAELIDAIWPDASVTENSLAQCLLEVRRALGDESQQIIATVARRGYKFTAAVATFDQDEQASDDAPAERRASVPAALSGTGSGVAAGAFVTVSLVVALAVGIAFLRLSEPVHDQVYVPLTAFTDSATNPAVSPDGRMLAFIRGSRTFLDSGQIYVKMLPDGEPVALTHDDRLKMAPVFSPDGTHIAYTAAGQGKWETWIVPVLGGEPRPLLANAAALSWIGDDRFLFSEIKHGLQMGVVAAPANRSETRDVYVPRGMAHRSYVSPNRRWALIASEMNAAGWLPCRLASMDGSEPARIVGPPNGKCTYAAWSPDGEWMYFSAEVDGGFHTWRQKFPEGRPEQITFGAADEEGIAMWPDGRSFASSVGTTVSSIWVHDGGNERQITSEGYGQLPSFSSDGNTLYYLLRTSGARQWAAGELWAVDLQTDKRRRIFPGISMADHDVSDDGARVVFARTDAGREGVWIGEIDSGRPPIQLSPQADMRALFGPGGTVVVEGREEGAKYLFLVRHDASSRVKVAGEPIFSLKGVSQDRRWAIVWPAGENDQRLVAYPLEGGRPLSICDRCSDSEGGPALGRTPPSLSWSRDGRYLYIRPPNPRDPLYEEGKTYILQLSNAGGLPPAFKSEAGLTSIPGMAEIPHGGIFPGPGPSRYAYTRAAIHRNIYRISLPNPDR